MLKTINDYFYFSQKERRGIFALIFIISILILLNIFVIPQMGSEKPINNDAFMAWVDSITQKPNQSKVIEYFNFDPNVITKKEWLKLGLSEDQIKVLLNYRNAGGRFYKKEDLKKIYSITDELYLSLEPYIIFSTAKVVNKKITQNLSIDLNSVDSTDLIKINGIGPVFAARILKYKKLLGGYSQASQLMEVYGIDSAKFHSIKHNFSTCDRSKLIRININTASFKELLKHPYISYEFVKLVVNERRKEVFKTLEDFKERTQLSDSVYQKLTPYLTIEK